MTTLPNLDTADYLHRDLRRLRVPVPVSGPTELGAAGWPVLAERGYLRLCARDGWVWVVGVDVRDPAGPAVVAVRTDMRSE